MMMVEIHQSGFCTCEDKNKILLIAASAVDNDEVMLCNTECAVSERSNIGLNQGRRRPTTGGALFKGKAMIILKRSGGGRH